MGEGGTRTGGVMLIRLRRRPDRDDEAVGRVAAFVVSLAVGTVFVTLWFVFPARVRRADARPDGPESKAMEDEPYVLRIHKPSE